MGIEQRINQQLNKYPKIKGAIKRAYQLVMYAISPKLKVEGDVVRVSPADSREYFFGYYDKSPWDAEGRRMLCMRAEDTWSSPASDRAAEILLIDPAHPQREPRVLAQTRAWNVQQGCMLQWLGPDFSSRIIFNDFRGGRLCSVILDVDTGEERVLPRPVYSVAADGKRALTLDFARLHRLRKGYGYMNLPDATGDMKLPDDWCIWSLNLETGEETPVLKYSDFAAFEPRPEMEGAEHKVNHIMISPNGRRFMVLHRWFRDQRKYTRLVTCDIDGGNMYNLSDDDMVSHCCWKNDEEILAFENKKGQGAGYYLMRDKTREYRRYWPQMSSDGHPSFSPDGALVVTDTYPNRARIASVKVMRGENVRTVARVFAPFRYDNDTRCDLHPRWSRDGRKVCIDSVFEGRRGLYVVNVSGEEK